MLLTILMYLAFPAFLGLSLFKIRKLQNTPMHGRLELYPIPKEPGRKCQYGGSYYEELEWWEKAREMSRTNEVKCMLKEMLVIKNLFENQKKHWLLSYPMHLGFYLMGIWTLLTAMGASLVLNGSDLNSAGPGASSPVTAGLYYATLLVGVAGLILVSFGSISLFVRRAVNRGMGRYTTPQEYFNLLFLAAVSVTGLLLWIGDPSFNYARDVIGSMFSFSAITGSRLLTAHLLMLTCLLVYIPLTKMSHYVGKYYSFHKVLWENEPNLRNSEMEQAVMEAMKYKPTSNMTWSAPHISGATAQKK